MPVLLDDGRIFVSLRCCGDRENKTFPSLKYWVTSEDGGHTFSAPQPLSYEDGSKVWSPSSYAGIIRSSLERKYYWIGNISTNRLTVPTRATHYASRSFFLNAECL